MAQAGLTIDFGFERTTPEVPEYDAMVARPVSTAAAPAIRDSSSKPKRVKTRDRSHKRVRFSLCPEVYERPCEVIRAGLTRSRYALRKSMARAHGKILGSPNSRATRTPADAILKANALRADVLADLGVHRSQVSLASVPRVSCTGGPAKWLMDTGSGLDLIGKRDVPASCRTRPADPVVLHTANGRVNVSSAAVVPVPELYEQANP
jgi:hypothetical protein